MVEMAILLPLLVLLAIPTIDLGRAFYYQEAIANVTREGARYGATKMDATSSEIETAALAEAGSLVSGITITSVKGVESVSGKYVSVAATYDFKLVTPYAESILNTDTIQLTSTSKMPAATTFTP